MATYTHNGGAPAVGAHPSFLKNVNVYSFFVENGQLKNATTGAAVTIVNADVLDIMTLPAGSVVLGAGVYVTTAGAASANVDIGDENSATRWQTDTSLAATGHTFNGTALAVNAATKMRLTFGGANPGTALKAHFYWVVADVTDAANTTVLYVT